MKPSDDTDAPVARLPRDERPSKTQLKKSSHDLQALGLALAEMPDNRLDPLGLPESLRDALDDLQRVRSHEGRRRHLQLIGKLMRQVDPEPLREAVASWKLPGARETLALHTAERWRDRLIADDAALTEWLAAHPGSDVQELRSLIRSARKDAAASPAGAPTDGTAERKGRSYRDLFQRVKATLAEAARSGPDDEEDGDDDA